MKKLIIGILSVCLVAGAASPVFAQGQQSLTVTRSTAAVKFPLELDFSLEARSDAAISDVRLRYSVDQESFADVTSEASVTFTPGTTVSAEWTMDMRRIGGFPPGTTIDYWWVVTDSSGARIETQPESVVFDDNRYDWRTSTEGLVTIYWYEGGTSFSDQVMSSAQDALVKLSAHTGADMKRPVKIYVYASTQDLLGALIFPYEWTGAVTYAQYGTIAIGISQSNLNWGERAIAHELSHMVIHQVTGNPYNELPRWLDEGLAVHNEGLLDVSFGTALQKAVNSDSLISARSLNSPFSAESDLAALSYAESFSLVDYLISKYGQDKMLELLTTFSRGSTYDNALLAVYGFNVDDLNDLWQSYVKDLFQPARTAVSIPGIGVA